ncbi:hypothetical protein ABIE44_003579 [Marmoricola sp. OAE513]|uniref:sortase domain-containing protein n=1 Tax=Marmoricola sp. OAE513 TaxID=2817894 RepID=UPI001AEA611B
MKHLIRTGVVTGAALLGVSTLSSCGGASSAPHLENRPTATVTVAAAPPTVVPVMTPAAAPRHVGRPTRVVIPRIKVDEALHGIGLKPDGAMQTPDFGDAAWYDLGPRPGARGPAVIVAHVHGPAGDDVFADLAKLRPGDRVTVRRTDGVGVFAVDAVEQNKKDSLPTKRIWSSTDQAVLRLITCGGTPDPVTRMYPENTVVYAHLISP